VRQALADGIMAVGKGWPLGSNWAGKEEAMSEEDTRRAMEAYFEDLLGQGPYKRHFSDDVVITMMGTDQEATGPDAAEQMIEYFHRQAFEARLEVRNMIVEDGQAVAELDFVGRHIGEFGGMAATGREVRVPYCVVYGLEGEKIEALRLYFPTDVLQRQLGAIPEPGQPEEASPSRARQELMERLANAGTPAEVAIAKAAADSWLATHPSDGDMRMARDQLPDLYPAGD
jgi:predicted ester cyclase